MNHARHHTAQPHACLAGGTIGRKPFMSQPVLDAIKAAGAKGANSLEIAEATGLARRTINESACNMRSRTGLIYTLGEAKRNQTRHFWHEVPLEVAQARFDALAAEKASAAVQAHKEAAKFYRRAYKAKKAGNREAAEQAKAEIARLALKRAEERKAKAEAHAKAKAEKKAERKTRMQNLTQRMNRLADKFRGTALPKEKAKEVTIVWPETVKVQQCPAWKPRFSDIRPAGVIGSQVGRYDTEASNWVQVVTQEAA